MRAWIAREDAWGIPMIVVIATVSAWYLLDPIYNGYDGYVRTFEEGRLSTAWWEVLLFLVAFGGMVRSVHHKMNGALPSQKSQIFEAMRSRRIDSDQFQDQVSELAKKTAIAWGILMAIGVYRVNFYLPGIFFPYLSYVGLVDPWGRDRLGGGIDALFAFAGYFQIMLTAIIGITLALSKRPNTIRLSGIVYFLAVPYFIFGRTRNTMLAVLIPAIMAFVTLRLKGGILVRLGFLAFVFAAFNLWFLFVLETRSQGGNIAMQAGEFGKSLSSKNSTQKHHEGFNMFEELGYINYFIDIGTYKPNWGARYFAEAVNPIPRVLWTGKPLIGIDYAIARGMAYGDLGGKSGGIAASISTGMIGQGVVNFGRFLGPLAAALLMAIWVAVLARQDLMGDDLGHLLLYAIGLVLTFNMGRDITLLVIYPFVFGWILLTWINKRKQRTG